jgi:hypothetical protein
MMAPQYEFRLNGHAEAESMGRRHYFNSKPLTVTLQISRRSCAGKGVACNLVITRSVHAVCMILAACRIFGMVQKACIFVNSRRAKTSPDIRAMG